jgi:hypothetical protein
MNTIFLPNDLGDLPKLMGTAMGLMGKLPTKDTTNEKQ